MTYYKYTEQWQIQNTNTRKPEETREGHTTSQLSHNCLNVRIVVQHTVIIGFVLNAGSIEDDLSMRKPQQYRNNNY